MLHHPTCVPLFNLLRTDHLITDTTSDKTKPLSLSNICQQIANFQQSQEQQQQQQLVIHKFCLIRTARERTVTISPLVLAMTKWILYVIIDILPIFFTGSIAILAYCVSLYCLVRYVLEYIWKRFFGKDLLPPSQCVCCQRLISHCSRVCPAKVSGLFKRYLQQKLLNFLKNRSRPLMDAEYGPLDRELREDEDLLNSDHDSVSPDIFVPLGTYVVLVSLLAIILAVKSFLLRRERICHENFDCFSLTGMQRNCHNTSDSDPFICYFWDFNVIQGINTFGGLTVTYYVSLKMFSFIFQFCYRYIKILRHSLLIVSSTLGALLVGFLNDSTNAYDGLTLFSVLVGFFLPCCLPWENLYPPQYMDDNIYDEETLMEVFVDNDSKVVEVEGTDHVNGVDLTSCNTQAVDSSVKKGDDDDHVWEIQGNGKS